MISIVVLGAGNVGTHLCKAINNAKNLNLVQWYNRSRSNNSTENTTIKKCYNLNNLASADVYIIAVNDNAIEQLSNDFPFKNQLVVHTSGSISMRFLNAKNRRGVFYPLQTSDGGVPPHTFC